MSIRAYPVTVRWQGTEYLSCWIEGSGIPGDMDRFVVQDGRLQEFASIARLRSSLPYVEVADVSASLVLDLDWLAEWIASDSTDLDGEADRLSTVWDLADDLHESLHPGTKSARSCVEGVYNRLLERTDDELLRTYVGSNRSPWSVVCQSALVAAMTSAITEFQSALPSNRRDVAAEK